MHSKPGTHTQCLRQGLCCVDTIQQGPHGPGRCHLATEWLTLACRAGCGTRTGIEQCYRTLLQTAKQVFGIIQSINTNRFQVAPECCFNRMFPARFRLDFLCQPGGGLQAIGSQPTGYLFRTLPERGFTRMSLPITIKPFAANWAR